MQSCSELRLLAASMNLIGASVVLNSPSEDGPGIMYKMHIMSPQLQKRKLHQGITENTLAEAS
jgi:hypothetical protein